MPTKVKGTTGVDKVEAGAVITNPEFSGNATVTGTLTVNSTASINGSNLPQQFGFRNLIINGDMKIDQRNAGSSVTATTAAPYTLDRWLAYSNPTSKFTVQQNAGSVTPPVGFTNYLGAVSSSSYSLNATDVFVINQNIEGLNIANLAWGTANAKTVTLSFQVYSSLTGTFGGVLRNSADNRSYPFTYSISSANTWTSISVTVAGDTSGTWLTNNGVGIRVSFGLGVGSTYSGTAGAWAGTLYQGATGATSVVGTSGATFYITGVQLEVGEGASDFEFLPYDVSLARCQRYYWKIAGDNSDYPAVGSGVCGASTIARVYVKYPVTMRTYPTFSYSGTVYAYDAINQTITSIAGAYKGLNTSMLDFTTSGLNIGRGCIVYPNNASTNYVQADAEL